MLNLSLSAVARGEVRVRGAIEVDDPVWEGTQLALVEPVTVDMVASSVGEGVLVRGSVRAVLALECRRCLTEVAAVVDDSVDLLFEELEAEEAEELGGEVYPLPTRGDLLDLRPAVREQLLLRVPRYVVCSPDCRGLCPRCGVDRNRTACACEPEPEAGPWDALKKLKFD